MNGNREALEDKARAVRMLVMDVDGVLTDGRIYYDNAGNELKAFHVRDGHGIVLAVRAGIIPVFITGRRSEAVARRAEELGITEVHQGIRDKAACFEDVCRRHGIGADAVACMGDDVVDLELLRLVGLAAAPRDADPAVLSAVAFTSRYGGGRGAVREFIEFIMRMQGNWPFCSE